MIADGEDGIAGSRSLLGREKRRMDSYGLKCRSEGSLASRDRHIGQGYLLAEQHRHVREGIEPSPRDIVRYGLNINVQETPSTEPCVRWRERINRTPLSPARDFTHEGL